MNRTDVGNGDGTMVAETRKDGARAKRKAVDPCVAGATGAHAAAEPEGEPAVCPAGGFLDAPVTVLHGIAAKRSALLGKLGIRSVRDLLLHIPVRYEDRTNGRSIASLEDGETCTVEAAAAAMPAHSRPRKTLSVWRLLVSDGTGYLNVTWFNRDFAVRNIREGDRFLFYGTVKRLGGQISMQNPAFERIPEGGSLAGQILPVYGLTEGVSQNQLRLHVREALHVLAPDVGEMLPEDLRLRHGLPQWQDAVHRIHFPACEADALDARRRLAFDELLELQVGLRVQRGASLRKAGVPMPRQSLEDALSLLPYRLTMAQARVLEELGADMEKPVAMNRLLQGDVGSGKTVVAFLMALSVIRSGHQVALMVPTEILADQHRRAAETLLEGLGVRISMLKGGMRKRERDRVLTLLREGGPDLVIGTHALLTEDVSFARLGLVITDEQHRFGVRQRAMLSGKGAMPHLLVMTATPIPRTLSLMLYGDLDISILDGLPPGRKPVRTYVVEEGMRPRIEAFVRKMVREGRQVYVVCPLVSESEELQAESAEALSERLRASVFPDLRIALLHGKMKPVEKDAVMLAFSNGETDILVSTTVIEVGVNVPNACVMIVENAERFGLSQLHQLRGRVGRGAEQSHCILFKGGGGKVAAERLKAIAETQDGFRLAELDLKLRGPGEMFGTRQSGLPECRIADPFGDLDLMQAARDEALLLAGPMAEVADPALQRLRRHLLTRFGHRIRDLAMN